MNFKTKITNIGDLVEDLKKDNHSVILFNDTVPEELQEISVVHNKPTVDKPIKVGDKIKIGNVELNVTAVGTEANHTLKSLGHCTLKFDGKNTTELPGMIELDANGIIPEFKVGDTIEVIYI